MPKRKWTLSSDLQSKYPFITTVSGSDVRCEKCGKEFNIALGGSSDITKHLSSKKHKAANYSASTSKTLTAYLSSTKDLKVAAGAEGLYRVSLTGRQSKANSEQPAAQPEGTEKHTTEFEKLAADQGVSPEAVHDEDEATEKWKNLPLKTLVVPEKRMSMDEGINLFSQVIRFCEQKSYISEQDMRHMYRIQAQIIKERQKYRKQTTMPEFFQLKKGGVQLKETARPSPSTSLLKDSQDIDLESIPVASTSGTQDCPPPCPTATSIAPDVTSNTPTNN